MQNIFETSYITLILIFTIIVIFIVGIQIGTYLHPVIKSMNPKSKVGISETQYNTYLDHLWSGMKTFFKIFMFFPLAYLMVKLWYDRENTTAEA